MLYREKIAVCSQIHTKHINILWGQNVELLNIKLMVHTVTTGIYKAVWPRGCMTLLSVELFRDQPPALVAPQTVPSSFYKPDRFLLPLISEISRTHLI
jgi:hypothetical protein